MAGTDSPVPNNEKLFWVPLSLISESFEDPANGKVNVGQNRDRRKNESQELLGFS